jgi:hypothetical protein
MKCAYYRPGTNPAPVLGWYDQPDRTGTVSALPRRTVELVVASEQQWAGRDAHQWEVRDGVLGIVAQV